MEKIVQTAISAGTFTTLVTTVQAADLVDTLNGDGPFTVLAPNDSAFAKIPKEALDEIIADKAQLAKILTYHVIPGKVMSKDIAEMTSATTVEGSTVTIDASDGVMINGAKVITADIECTNGVIHVIDTVLMPE